MSKKINGLHARSENRGGWLQSVGISNLMAIRVVTLTFYMVFAQFAVVVACAIYFSLQMMLAEAYVFLISVGMMVTFSRICFRKGKEIQRLSDDGDTEGAVLAHRQGKIYLGIFSVVFSIVTFALLYSLL